MANLTRSVGNQIDRLRLARGIDLNQFCRLSGLEAEVLAESVDPRGLSTAVLDKAATALGVPLYTLLGQSDVPVDRLPEDYRTEGNRAVLLTKHSLKAIYRAYDEADFIVSLSGSLRQNQSTDIPARSDGDTAASIAKALREFVGVSGSQLCSIEDPYQAFNVLRYKIEAAGCYVFSERVRDSAFRGFCFERSGGKFLLINSTGQSPRARLFTLAHELAHLFVGRLGVVAGISSRRQVERECNAITARYLLPKPLLLQKLAGAEEATAAALVNRVFSSTPYSQFFIAMRIQELGGEYVGFVNRWLKEVGVRRPSNVNLDEVQAFETDLNDLDAESNSDNAFKRQGSGAYHSGRLGFSAVSLVKTAYEHNVVSVFDVESSLNVPAKNYVKLVESHTRRLNEVQRNAPQ